ncbi:MAG TPA: diaminopimelate epimerase [Vicinamibacterales bacterium]|nr:diaminopimelate epimerase [Vicinamibacterales bacterium]
MLSLAKAHAYGNDFLFIPHDQAEALDPHALARATCARHTGIGGDGLILYTIAPDGTARMTLYNADGSPSELSGNGLRCLAALVLHLRASREGTRSLTEVRVETDAGWKMLTLVSRNSGRYTFRAAMGQPTDVAEETIAVNGESLRITTLGMGNPQCVTLVDELPDDARFNRLGPALATHPRFKAGTNVEFAKIEAPDRVRILIWERGVGPTMASGTGACASAVAAIAHGGAKRDIDVIAPGGTQRVEWRDDGVYLTGWAEMVFDGQWLPHPELLKRPRT